MTVNNIGLENASSRERCDLLITNAFIISMDEQRRMIRNGGIAVTDDCIVYVGSTEDVLNRYQGKILDAGGGVVHPGLIDGHEHVCFHITRGWEPDWFSIHDTWTMFESKAFPALTAQDQILSMKLAQVEMLKNGVTAFCDTGTAFFPDEVMPERNAVGIRGLMGGHIGDTFVPELAFLDKTTEQAVRRIEDQLQRYSDGRVRACVGMSGMGNCSDALVIQAKELARRYDRVLHMHQCVYPAEMQKYQERYGKTPIEHLHDLGVLDAQTALVHMIHVTHTDIDLLRETGTRIVHCPGASLKYAMGAMRMGMYPAMHKAGLGIALGTDASNWADGLDILMQVYLCATVHREMHPADNSLYAETALEMATLGGAMVLGMAGEVGAVKPGMRADLVIHRTDVPECVPAFDPLTNLVYAARSKSVDTVLVDGEIVLSHGKVTRLDEGALYEQAQRAAFDLANRIGYRVQSHWPVVTAE